MVNIKINGKNYKANKNITALQACRNAGIKIPTLCYLKEINEIGSCRICLIEVKGENKLVSSCNTTIWEGMEIFTDTPKIRQAREINLKLILSQHNKDCTSCVRNKNCTLQSLCEKYGINENPYMQHIPKKKSDESFPLIRDTSRCISCLRCVNLCDKIQSLGIWDFVGSGSSSKVLTASGKKLSEDDCTLCGQCITHCPVGALRERDDTDKVINALNDKDKITILQIAPAVRAAWGEQIGLPKEIATEKRLVAAAKALGFDYVFDTNFSADLTVMEEGAELVSRLTENKGFLPMFTSCCPGWVRFVKSQYPEFTKNLSTAKSPQQMFGAIAKTYFAQKINVNPKTIFCVSAMPCVAKKAECDMPSMISEDYGKDVDSSITTRELVKMIKTFISTDISDLPEIEFDSPLGTGSGAAVLFGATGGVMEAALRTCHYLLTGKNPEIDSFKNLRGNDGLKFYKFDIDGKTINCAVASGLGNARIIMEEIKLGKGKYDFIEIMACPGGCAGGGGQPICDGEERAGSRADTLYGLDKENSLRFSHENIDIIQLYDDFLGKPNSNKAHKLLHIDHNK